MVAVGTYWGYVVVASFVVAVVDGLTSAKETCSGFDIAVHLGTVVHTNCVYSAPVHFASRHGLSGMRSISY